MTHNIDIHMYMVYNSQIMSQAEHGQSVDQNIQIIADTQYQQLFGEPTSDPQTGLTTFHFQIGKEHEPYLRESELIDDPVEKAKERSRVISALMLDRANTLRYMSFPQGSTQHSRMDWLTSQLTEVELTNLQLIHQGVKPGMRAYILGTEPRDQAHEVQALLSKLYSATEAEAIKKGIVLGYLEGADEIVNEESANDNSQQVVVYENEPVLTPDSIEQALPQEIKDSLSPRQLEIVLIVCSSPSRTSLREIASIVGIAESTLKNHLVRVYDNVGVINRSDLRSRIRRSVLATK